MKTEAKEEVYRRCEEGHAGKRRDRGRDRRQEHNVTDVPLWQPLTRGAERGRRYRKTGVNTSPKSLTPWGTWY